MGEDIMAKKATKFLDTTRGKTLKVAVYVAVSAAIGYLITVISNDASVVGGIAIAGVVNIILVAVKNLIDKNVPN